MNEPTNYPPSKEELFPAQARADAMKTRDKVERFFDRHNHTMAFVRTVFAIVAGVASSIVLLKMVHLI